MACDTPRGASKSTAGGVGGCEAESRLVLAATVFGLELAAVRVLLLQLADGGLRKARECSRDQPQGMCDLLDECREVVLLFLLELTVWGPCALAAGRAALGRGGWRCVDVAHTAELWEKSDIAARTQVDAGATLVLRWCSSTPSEAMRRATDLDSLAYVIAVICPDPASSLSCARE